MTALEEQLTRALRRAIRAVRNGTAAAIRAGRSLAAARRAAERGERKSCSGESSGSTCWRHAWPSIPGHPPPRDRAASVSDAPSGTGSRSGSEPLTMASSRLPPERRSARRAVSRPSGGEPHPARSFNRADRAVHRERNRMMARTNKSRRSYSTGEWGRNRVRVFPDPRTGIIQVQWREDGRRISRSLKHRDWDRAKKTGRRESPPDSPKRWLRRPRTPSPSRSPLHTLFDIYREEVTPTKTRKSRRHDRAAMKMFLRFFGKHRQAKNPLPTRLGPLHPGRGVQE